jgi:hypothetical protein
MSVQEKTRRINLRLSKGHVVTESIRFDGTESYFSLSCDKPLFPALTVQLTGHHKTGLFPFTTTDNGHRFPVENFTELKLFQIDNCLSSPITITVEIW